MQTPRRRRRRIAATIGLRRGRAAIPWFVQVLYLGAQHGDIAATGARHWFRNNVKMMGPTLVELVKPTSNRQHESVPPQQTAIVC